MADNAAKHEFIPSETYSFVQHNQLGRRGGGTELLFNREINVKKIDAGEKSSFEYFEWRVKFRTLRARLIIIYRPPYWEKHPVTPCTFFDEFS